MIDRVFMVMGIVSAVIWLMLTIGLTIMDEHLQSRLTAYFMMVSQAMLANYFRKECEKTKITAQ